MRIDLALNFKRASGILPEVFALGLICRRDAGSTLALHLAETAGVPEFVAEITAELDVFQVLELRSVIGFFILLPLVMVNGGFAAMRTGRPFAHIARNVIHYTGQAAWLYALTLIPLAVLISIEFTTPIWTYLDQRVSAARIKNGIAAIDANRALFTAVGKHFGVDPYILGAIWGIETSYGAVLDNPKLIKPVIRSLATLVWQDPEMWGALTDVPEIAPLAPLA